MSKQHKSTGIVLHTQPLFESDKLVEILTAETGKIKCLAKSAQKKATALEVGNEVHVILYQRKNLPLITQSTVIRHAQHIRSNFNAISLMGYIISLIRNACSFDQSNPNLYLLLKNSLETLNSPEVISITQNSLNTIKTHFETQFLLTEGLMDPKNPNAAKQFKDIYQSYTGNSVPIPLFI